jgi:acyl-CoA thioester hydrolase
VSPPDPAGPTPLGTGAWTVPAEWIDYNGHMMDGYYGLAFSDATEAFLDLIGLGEAYRKETGSGMYTVESHLCYRRSARAGQQLRFTTQVLGADAKRVRVFHRMTDAATGDEVATNELMFLHVDGATERVTAMPPERGRVVAALAGEHAALPAPQAAGRAIGLARGTTPQDPPVPAS